MSAKDCVTWGRWWRKLVKWDAENKLYVYRGYNIYPLSFKDQRDIPVHRQNDHYWSEIDRIDEIIAQKQYREEHKEELEKLHTVDEI